MTSAEERGDFVWLNPLRRTRQGPKAAQERSAVPDNQAGRGVACVPGGNGVMAMAAGWLPTVMVLPGLLVAVLTGVTVWSLLPA